MQSSKDVARSYVEKTAYFSGRSTKRGILSRLWLSSFFSGPESQHQHRIENRSISVAPLIWKMRFPALLLAGH